MGDLRLYSVNWQDGMLITQQHLKDQEKYFEDLAQWYNLDIGDRYGLVRRSLSGKPALDLNARAGSGKLRVSVVKCQAVTPDGSFIEIAETSDYIVKAETDLTDGPVPVFISVTRDTKNEIGQPDPAEDVPRTPYRIPGYQLHLGQPPNLPSGSYLQVAQLSVVGGEIRPTEGFYPPSFSLNSDASLAKKATDFKNRLENLLSLASRAYMAIETKGTLAAEKTELQIAFKDTVYRAAYHLSATLDDFIVGRNAIHPSIMVIHFKKLFRVITTMLNLQPALKDYLNEKHFTKEAGSEIGRFMSSIDSFLLSEYDHQNIGGQVGMIDEILTGLRGVLGFLAQTKKEELGREAVATDSLTYIGRTYKLVGYSACKLEQVGELSYLLVGIERPQPASDIVVLIKKDLFGVAEWSNMQVRLGLNEARGLGETDPIEVDTVTFGAKVALRPQDMLPSQSVGKLTLIFRGASNPKKFDGLGKLDFMIYAF
jgi:hypothetical protein